MGFKLPYPEMKRLVSRVAKNNSTLWNKT